MDPQRHSGLLPNRKPKPQGPILRASRATRNQRTLATEAVLHGVGLFTNADVSFRLCPAEPGIGIVFRRISGGRKVSIPAHIDFLVDTPRHTSVAIDGVSVEMIEHTLAALAGLQITNCIVTVDGPELPGLDGSAAQTVDAILQAGIVEQNAAIEPIVITERFQVSDGRGGVISGEPTLGTGQLEITYLLDHPAPAVGRQSAAHVVTPQSFIDQIGPARTFVLENEVDALLAAGYGQRLTHQDLCVFGESGLIDNTIRFPNEPARHKLLDCVGDFALAGRPLVGRIIASRSGHALNHAFVRKLLSIHSQQHPQVSRAA